MFAPSPSRLGCRAVAAALSLVVIVSLLAISAHDPGLGARLVDENDVVEWLQVVLAGAAGVLAFQQGRAARRAGQPATLEVAIVAAMAIICIGEVDLDRAFFGTKIVSTIFIFVGLVARRRAMMSCMPVRSLIVIALAAVGLAGCRGEIPASAQEKPKPAPPTREVRVIPATERAQPRTVVATGTLAAEDQVTLSAKVAGRVETIEVDLGTRVQRGQPIARLDQTDFKLRIEQAEAALQQARARLGLTPTGADERIDPERTSIVRQARAVLDEARLTRDRSIKLLEQQLIARAQLDTAEANMQVAEGRYQDALEEVRNRQGVLAQRRSELDLARQQLTDTVVLAPVDGAVSQRLTSRGEYLAAGAPMATLVRIHPLRLRVSVPEREASSVRPGQMVRLTIEGDQTVYTGRVVRLAPIVQEMNRTLAVEAEVPNERGVLRAGAFARAEIVTEAAQPVLTVPASALVVFAGVEKVLVVRGGKTTEVRVQTGRRLGGEIEILEGLKRGESVVDNPGNLTGGQAVSVKP
jgi:RND family efflux transporter MFP subunit